MEIVLGLISMSITVLGAILAYIWRSNGRFQVHMMAALERMMAALERIEQGQERLERIMIEGLERLAQIQIQGQREIIQAQKDIAQMLVNQSKILERIESRV